MDPYDIGQAFDAIEDELIDSMIRNMKRHHAEEMEEGIQWTMWQAEQLKALAQYRRDNQKKFRGRFAEINERIDEAIREAGQRGYMDQETEILKAIRDGFQGYKKASNTMQGEFFRLNDRKLEALIQAVTSDMEKAETAILRMADDQYRKAIFNAQVYANTGAGTYEKAVDMATKDMLSSGLNCVQYKNGARHRLKEYAEMALRTAGKRAYLQGEGTKRQEWGITTVIINKRGNPCPKCLPFCGKVMIDDVWSGGSKDGKSPVTGLKYPLISRAIDAGLYHPNCRDSHATYFEGISTPPDNKYSKDELDQIAEDYRKEQKRLYAERQEEKYSRMAKYSLDEDNKREYGRKANSWKGIRFRTGQTDSRQYADSKRPLANFKATPQDKVVSVLRQDSEEWLAGLTEEEKWALKKYTYNSGDMKPNRFFERLNAMLRGDIEKDNTLEKYAATISKAIKKNNLQRDIIAFRGMDADPIGELPQGALIKPRQFFSSSVINNRSFNAKYKLIIYVKKGSDAAYIEKLSYFRSQRELLLDKDCIYRVLSKKNNIIELEVI